MTKVKWYPVVVDDYGKIKKGEKPGVESEDVYVTYSDKVVGTMNYVDDSDGFGDGYPHTYLEEIIAWAYVEMPEPYRPEVKNE